MVASGVAMAQTPPLVPPPVPPTDAGRLLEENRQANRPPVPTTSAPRRLLDVPGRATVEMPDGVTVTPSEFKITGAQSFPADQLAELVKPWVGRKLDLAGLNEAAGAITRKYQSAGHLLTYAYVPAQKVADGVIEIAVLEGRIEGVEVVNAQDVRLRDEVVQAHVGKLAEAQPVLQPEVERKLLLLNDIPGVVARGAFTPGATQGAAEMVVSVAEEEPLQTEITGDNYGSKSSGQYRAGLGLQFRDLFGYGDYTQARVSVSNRGSLVSGNLSTLVPVGGSGWKLGANVSALRYQLAGEFAQLGAEGNAVAYALNARYPVLRTADANVNLDLSAERKRLRDDVQLIGQSDPKSSNSANAVIGFDWRDSLGGGGQTAGSVSLTSGVLHFLNDVERAKDDATLQTAGSYKKALLAITRQQSIFGPFSGYVRFTGQYAHKNLDSSEKLALGGPYGVRAYAPGEGIVDDGQIATLEFRYTQNYLGGSLLWSLFQDRATGRVNYNPLAGASGNDVHLFGTGLGLQWNTGDLGVSATIAWRGNRVPTAEGGDPSPRLYVQIFYAP